MRKFGHLIITLFILTAILPGAERGNSQSQRPDEAHIAAYLAAHSLLVNSGASVLGVNIQGEALVINLSQEILPEGIYAAEIFKRLQDDLDRAFDINLFFMTTFKVEGKALEDWGRPLPEYGSPVDPPLPSRQTIPDGPLSGVKIALGPGHGIYWNEIYAQWRYQRLEFWGIREDILNAEIMRYVTAALANQGATVIQLRELDFNARTGFSAYPAWHEGSREYGIALGLPSWIVEGGSTNYNSDIRARPYMANYYGADLLINLHNNGYNGQLTGTETYYDTNNHPGSPSLATAVHTSIIDSIQSEYDPSWVDRGVKSSDDNYGEINYAQMPAVLIELAFMDRQYPDNAYLHDEAFKLLAANAITQGICNYWGVTCEESPITLPVVDEVPQLIPPYGSGMCDSGWYRFPNERGEYAYLALNVSQGAEQSHQALWTPDLPVSGQYRLEAFIPGHNPLAWTCPPKTIREDTSHAIYEINHANGQTPAILDQSNREDEWVNLGIYHFNDETEAGVALTDVTGEADHTKTVSASAMRFTLVGYAGTPFHNTPWVDTGWLTEEATTSTDHIRNFLLFHHSCLVDPLLDADGQEISFPEILHQAASANQVNPKLLLALMEAEVGALSHCPDETALASLMGQLPPSTAREQVSDAAVNLRGAINALSAGSETPNGWSTGVPKTTLDGVTVIPATESIAVLFDFNPYAGSGWGGNLPGENGVQAIYLAYHDFSLANPLPGEILSSYLSLIAK